MVDHRWRRILIPGLVALGAAAAIGSVAGAAADRTWLPLACGLSIKAPPGKAAPPPPISLTDMPLGSWFRLAPKLDVEGSLVGQQLTFGVGAGARRMDLPAESFASGPFGGLVLVGTDDGVASRLLVIDTVRGCSTTIAQEAAVIRRGSMSPDGSTVFETRVDRSTRADLGVWKRPATIGGVARRILAPLDPDDRFGRSWSTEFLWSAAGDRLAVQSCGETACRTRVVDPATSVERVVAEPDLGPMIGLVGDDLVSYGSCRGLPCPLVTVDVGTGRETVLTDAAGSAVLSGSGNDVRVVHEVLDGVAISLRAVRTDGREAKDLGALPDGTSLQADPIRSGIGTAVPPGWVLLATDGALAAAAAPADPASMLRQISDGRTVRLDEVSR